MMRNKRRRLAASADVPHEVAVNQSSQHSRVVHISGQSVASPSHSIISTLEVDPLSFTPCGRLSKMDNPSAISYSACLGKNRKSNKTDKVDDDSSDEIDFRPPDDRDLLRAINSESSYEAVALFTSENAFTPDGLDQALLAACRRGHKLLVQTLVRIGANIEHRDEHANTPLLICAENGFMDIVKFLVSKHANVSAVNSVGNTALILSVRSAGAFDLTKFLVEQRDVDIHHGNQHGHTALIRATQFMDLDVMRFLLEKSMRRKPDREYRQVFPREYNMDRCFFNSIAQEIKQQISVDKTGLGGVYEIFKEHLTAKTSPLELAIKAGDTKSLDMFLDCQFSSREEKKTYVDSALKYVFQNQQHNSVQRFSSTDVTIIQKLLQYGADVNQRSGPRMISLAVESGNFQVVELLCTHGADMKGFYSSNEDPLVKAAKKGRRDLIELLLKYKADIDRPDFSTSALDHALRNDHTACVKLLIKQGAEMDVKSALISAIDHQVSKYMQFLFENYNLKIKHYFSQRPLEARILLTSAAEKGNCEIIGQLLDAGIDINEADSAGQTPLMASKNREVAEFLIRRGADVNQKIEGRNGSDTVLSHVIKNRVCKDKSTVELCKVLIYNQELEGRNGSNTVLSRAIKSRVCKDKSTVELCKVLIDNGALVNCRSEGDKTPLMLIAAQDDCVDVLQMLLDNGADVDDKDSKGNTALFHAVRRNNSKNVACLIGSGALVNCRSGEDKTPLLIAASQDDCVDMLQMLLDNGAGVNDKDGEGNTAIFHAVRRQNSKHVTCLLGCSRDKKSLINIQNKGGITPLIFSVQKGKFPIVKQLLDNGADVNIKDNQENTALHHLLIAHHGNLEEILTSLLKAGSHVNWQNSHGLSPLMLATKTAMASLISKLLDAGADVNAVSKKNKSQTALSFLPHFKMNCIEILLNAGARCSYLSRECIHKLIIGSKVNIILKLTQHGVGPADMDKVQLKIRAPGVPSTVSPLCFALLLGKVHLARYFVDILYLTSSDLSMFASSKVMECLLQREDQKDSLTFLREISSQPISLSKLCLVAVSAAVGSSPGRETRVDSLPLPQMMKDKLLFNSGGGEHATLADVPSGSNSARFVSLLRHLRILQCSDSDDDDDDVCYASDPSGSNDGSYDTDYDYD